jgi:hypothetical protein
VVASSQKMNFSRAVRSPCGKIRQAMTLLLMPTAKNTVCTAPPFIDGGPSPQIVTPNCQVSPSVNEAPAKEIIDQNRLNRACATCRNRQPPTASAASSGTCAAQ